MGPSHGRLGGVCPLGEEGGEKEKSLGLVSFFCKQPQSNCAILKKDEMGGMI
jgi:hypothetical protein